MALYKIRVQLPRVFEVWIEPAPNVGHYLFNTALETNATQFSNSSTTSSGPRDGVGVERCI